MGDNKPAPFPLPGNLPRGTASLPPPHTPRPPRKEETTRKALRSGLPALRKHLEFDFEDEEKENKDPRNGPQKEEEQTPLTPPDLLSLLLQKLGQAIDQLGEDIIQELKDCKSKLGIPQY
ncbi:E1/E4 protein [Human papillomavirus type 221]|uniref:E1/E4 protein n=1 Tax=Human papillomavirus type 221 TaxID=2200958 RepID=A0A2S1ZRX8_9PAPI|nr:E1/E4 protein [Human papillomavirus type 221]